MNKGPIFVVGMNGSGTTMLADSLGRHPDIYSMPQESKVLPYYLQRYGEQGKLSAPEARRELAECIGREKPFWQSNGKRNIELQDNELDCPSFSAVVDTLYRKLMTGNGKSRWCDKSPINTQHIAALANAFPEAQFLHIIRDGRDAAQSFHRRWGYHPLHTITRWKNVVEEGCRQGASLSAARYMELHYEQLTTQPRGTMAAVCDFLKIPFHEAVLESSMRYMDTGQAQDSGGKIIKNSGKWKNYFSTAQIQKMEFIAGNSLLKHGYAVGINGDSNPPMLTKAWWRLRDRINFSWYFLNEYGLNGLPAFARKLVTSAKQWSSARF